jgi:hypothetical protein
MATLMFLPGVGKARPNCCRVVCLGGFCGLFLESLGVFPFVLVWVLWRVLLYGLFCGLF